jgi:NADPH:quinone reductase-like Zn-dependent oxidoreductase
MRAVIIREHGGPDVLRSEEIEDPTPAPGEVLVRVRAAALNHLDLWNRRGRAGRTVPFPHVLGSDVAGEVADANGVDGVAAGTRVLLAPGLSCGRCRACLGGADNFCRQYRILGLEVHGGYAELVRCPAPNLVALPEGFSFEEAAAFPLVFLTAWHMLVTRARLAEGENVLVWGAGSGVGMAAIQVAKALGARVLATAGDDVKLEKARSVGADAVVNHASGDVLKEVRRFTERKGVDVVVEHPGAATWERSIHALAHGGRLVTCGATTGPVGGTDLLRLFAKQLSILGSYMGGKAELLDVARLFFERRVRAVIHAVLPLAEARQAHEALEASRQFGKIVLVP